MYTDKDNLADTINVISYFLGFNKIKLGNEGIMLHYELTRQIAEEFCKTYDENYDWETHRDNGGHDWDVEAEEFADLMIKNNPVRFHIDEKYHK